MPLVNFTVIQENDCKVYVAQLHNDRCSHVDLYTFYFLICFVPTKFPSPTFVLDRSNKFPSILCTQLPIMWHTINTVLYNRKQLEDAMLSVSPTQRLALLKVTFHLWVPFCVPRTAFSLMSLSGTND